MAKPDIYTRITEKIIADLEAGTRPRTNPGMPNTSPVAFPGPCATTASPTGASTSSCSGPHLSPMAMPHPPMTYRQALELGGQVRKGSKGQLVIYADKMRKTETDDAGQIVRSRSLHEGLYGFQRRSDRGTA